MSLEEQQRQLASLWVSGRAGTLGPWSQAKVWALKEVWTELHPHTTHGRNTWIASKVSVIKAPDRGKGERKGKGNGRGESMCMGKGNLHPSEQAIGKLITKMEEGAEWFPGKRYGSMGGRPSVLSETNKAIIARSAMALKQRGIPPTGPLVLAQCPAAARNPNTGEPVAFQRLYDVFGSRCFDNDPGIPWECRKRLCKQALTQPLIERRLAFGRHMETLHQEGGWDEDRYFEEVVWADDFSTEPFIIRRKIRFFKIFS